MSPSARLLYFVRLHNSRLAARWEGQHAVLLARIQQRRGALEEDEEKEEAVDEDIIPEEAKNKIEKLDEVQYDVGMMVAETFASRSTACRSSLSRGWE
jgi:hypothetical protein